MRLTLLTIVGCASCLAGCGTATSAPTPKPLPVGSRCDSTELRVTASVQIYQQTGEDGHAFVLTNRSSQACSLTGYPKVGLYANSRLLPFSFSDGGSSYTTIRRPRLIRLRPGAAAYVLIAKYRCDGRIAATASRLRLGLPDGGGQLQLRLSADSSFSHCHRYPGDLPIDPGNKAEISPLSPTLAATNRP
jgi:hypothetical protein